MSPLQVDEGARAREEALKVSMAKLWISEAMMRASYTRMQVMGGYGYTLDSNMQLHWRNARLGTIGTGSSEIQRNIIARQLGLSRRPSKPTGSAS